MTMFDRGNQVSVDELLSPPETAERVEREEVMDEGIYLERDTLLDDDFFEPSLDDFDDLLADMQGDDWDA